jgi:ribonuclease Z
MKIKLLGTGTPTPSLTRMGSSHLIQIGDDVILLDHGPGAHHRLLQAGIKATEVTHIAFSHLHYDHCIDYVRLVLTRWDQGAGQIPELKVFGPPPIDDMTKKLFGHDGAFATDINARVNNPSSIYIFEQRGGIPPRCWPLPEVTEMSSGNVIDNGTWQLQSIGVPHAQPQLNSLGFRIDSDEGSVVYSGDSGPSNALARLGEGCDVMIHMCNNLSGSIKLKEHNIGGSGHLEAANIASKAGVKILVLTHMYGQIDIPGIRERIVKEISEIYDGIIIMGEDLMDIPLTPPSLAKFQ